MDRPIIFSGSMVRALLDGRKSQTRRILKPQPPEGHRLVGIYAPGLTAVFNPAGRDHRGDPDRDIAVRLPYSLKDRLWVREVWTPETDAGIGYPPPYNDGRPIKWTNCPWYGRYWFQPHYRATDPVPDLSYSGEDNPLCKWRSPIHMPRWASRLTLTVSDVRVQRLQEISEEDAEAEGAERPKVGTARNTVYLSYRAGFSDLWESIHGLGAWDANPWIAAISFSVDRRNIDSCPERADVQHPAPPRLDLLDHPAPGAPEPRDGLEDVEREPCPVPAGAALDVEHVPTGGHGPEIARGGDDGE